MGLRDLWRRVKQALRSPLGRRKKDTAGGRILSASGEEVLLDEAEETPGTADATAFFTAVVGKSMKELLGEFGMTNIAPADDKEWKPGRREPSDRFGEFRTLGYLVHQSARCHIYARPSRYPFHGEGGSAPVIGGAAGVDADLMTPHATVVFTVRETLSPDDRKRMTVHFYGRGEVRAKGYVWRRARPDRPKHYEGEEIRELVEDQAGVWAKRIYWCEKGEKG